ncbi:MAG: nucleotide sugar dehydrogenase [Bacteroidota bacterium]|nr:nucleotide sugar dehydrogenase [Bacteroidota bacterium]MDP4191162.1 nucleotide sugar dehydrogenase [Bacteroidota bacterium]MDP4195035.1 nucleotide sugar dehydrogenase [Bacteroidota bacterium]
MKLIEKINDKSAVVGVIGLGYVGLPLALEFALKGFNVIGFDVDKRKMEFLEQKKTYIKHINSEKIANAVESGRFTSTSDFSRLTDADAIIICVPTPLDEHREPDMRFVIKTANTVADYLREGQLVVLESTTYPGTTDEVLLPLFENAPNRQKLSLSEEKTKSFTETSYFISEEYQFPKDTHKHFRVGKDFYLAFSPEREDPNNKDYSTTTIPKVVGGVTPSCREIAKALYDTIIVKTIPVSSTRVAEATKLLENIYRSVNIALVNELKMVFDKMDIDIWEVIEAASSKPFGFHPFYPGPGLGGHCIPIDPFYLTWKVREHDVSTKFIELAGEINTFQPYYVVDKAIEALNKLMKSLNGSKVLILGAAYKKDIDDMRESPSLKLIEILRDKGALVSYHDPYVLRLPKTRKYNYDMQSIHLSKHNIADFDLVILSTDHSSFDYEFIFKNAELIVDTRNAFGKRGLVSSKVVKA